MSPLSIAGSNKGLKSKRSFTLLCLPAAVILAVFASRAFSDDLPIGIVLFDCVLIVLNFMGVLVSVTYVTKVELYADLPQDLPSLPSFGPEVSFYRCALKNSYSIQAEAFNFVYFQDVPTGYKSANLNERVDEVSSSQKAEHEEEQEDVVISNPDGEVRNQHRV